MKPLLIIGLDSIVGANAAALFSETRDVYGYFLKQKVNISDVKNMGQFQSSSLNAVNEIINQISPGQILLVPPVGSSSWYLTESTLDDSLVDDFRNWAIAAQKQQIPLTLVSADTVFTGPWMFHEEDSTGLNSSKQAVLTRILESEVMAWHPDSLVVRTNVFGWTPQGMTATWVESLINIGNPQVLKQLDTLRNATPIAATTFLRLLENSWNNGLNGVYHIAGAERCHPVKLAQKIGEVFKLNWKNITSADNKDHKNQLRFGFGETSLQTKKIRHALQVSMPMLEESVEQLYAEYQNGFADKVRPFGSTTIAKAA